MVKVTFSVRTSRNKSLASHLRVAGANCGFESHPMTVFTDAVSRNELTGFHRQ